MRTIEWLLLIVALYLGTAFVVFEFRHPAMTETQRFLHMKDALLFRRVPTFRNAPVELR